MRKTIYGALIILLSCSTAAVRSSAHSAPQSSAASTPPSDAPTGDARKGATAFSDCVNCHGHDAEGGFAPSLAGVGMSWPSFRKAVREPWGIMPAFREQQKSDQALADIYAYLHTLPRTAALGEWHWRKAPRTAPLGQRMYMNFAGCGQCHEPEGKFPRARLGVWRGRSRSNISHDRSTSTSRDGRRAPCRSIRRSGCRRSFSVKSITWLVDELGMRPWIAGSLALDSREGGNDLVHADRVEQRREGQGAGGRGADGLRQNPERLLGRRRSRNRLRGHDAAGEARARTGAANGAASARRFRSRRAAAAGPLARRGCLETSSNRGWRADHAFVDPVWP